MTTIDLPRALRLAIATLAALFAFACDGKVRPEDGSETHFLSRCDDECGDGLECVCGICTTVCENTAACSEHGPAAECSAVETRTDLTCELPTRSLCDVGCRADADCLALGSRYTCDGGYCRATGADGPARPPLGAPLGTGCESNRVGASELLVIGDSLFELSGMAGYLDELARAEGSLLASESYRDHSSSLTSFLAQNAFSLTSQYSAAALEGPARIVVMNGGATDLLQAGCPEPPNAQCPLVVDAVAGARSLLAQMAGDGVESIVYAFYADPLDNPGLLSRIDVLRPQIAAVCDESPVPCHFLDLRPVFAGHYAEYVVGVDGIVFSASGAEATAQAIWSLMKERCVAP